MGTSGSKAKPVQGIMYSDFIFFLFLSYVMKFDWLKQANVKF